MGTESLEFSDVSHSEDASLTRGNGKGREKGLFISPAVAFIYVLVTILIAVGVGLIVHFAHPGGDCRCDCASLTTTPAPTGPPTTTDPDLAWELCYNLSVARNECLPCPPGEPTAPPLPTEAPPITGLRLPRTLIPWHYNVEVKPDIYKDNTEDFEYEGWVDIYLKCEDETDLIVLHYRMMTIDNSSVSVRDAETDEALEVAGISKDAEREFYRITLVEKLEEGDEIVVSLEYSGPLRSGNSGMFWNEYHVDGEARYGLQTQFEATDARKAFPCLDEPDLKATFNITLWRKTWMVALSNMPVEDAVPEEDGWISEHYEKTPVVMPTYLIAFGIANFTYVNATSAGGNFPGKDMRFYAPPDAIRDGHADYIAGKEGIMFDWLEDYFNHTFALPKLDSITINEFSSGAMENWGLVTYRESRLLWDPLYSTEYEKQRAMGTNAHELLHMWLGNVVTCKWWDSIWLQETMARFYQYPAIKEAEPYWDTDQIFTAQTVLRALGADSTGRSHPMYNPTVETPAQISSMFSAISYDKGACVVRMIQQLVMGDDSYDAAMREYVDTMQYSNAEHDDLFRSWDNHVDIADLPPNRDLTNIMYTWIKQMGYPVVKFDRDGNTVKVTQEMFLLDPERPEEGENPSHYGYKWDIPISYTTSDDVDALTKDWFLFDDQDGPELSVPASVNWILANPGWKGFYRVNYNPENWDALVTQLETDHEDLYHVDRARLIDDSMQLARADLLDQVIALDTTKYLAKEGAYIVWYAARSAFDYIDKIFYPISAYALFQEYVRNLAEPHYTDLGWQYEDDEDLMTNYMRSQMLDVACHYGNQDCIANATKLFQTWRDNPTDMTILKPEIRSLVYCTQIKYGHPESWDFLLAQYQDNWHSGPDAVERGRMRDALGCSRQPWILDRYFRLAAEADESIYSKDRTSALRAVARNPVGKHVAWDYMSGNWYKLISRTTIMNDVAAHFSTEFELEKLQDFMRKHPPVTAGEVSRYEDAEYTVKANVRWRQTNEQKIIDWLEVATVSQNSARGG